MLLPGVDDERTLNTFVGGLKNGLEFINQQVAKYNGPIGKLLGKLLLGKQADNKTDIDIYSPTVLAPVTQKQVTGTVHEYSDAVRKSASRAGVLPATWLFWMTAIAGTSHLSLEEKGGAIAGMTGAGIALMISSYRRKDRAQSAMVDLWMGDADRLAVIDSQLMEERYRAETDGWWGLPLTRRLAAMGMDTVDQAWATLQRKSKYPHWKKQREQEAADTAASAVEPVSSPDQSASNDAAVPQQASDIEGGIPAYALPLIPVPASGCTLFIMQSSEPRPEPALSHYSIPNEKLPIHDAALMQMFPATNMDKSDAHEERRVIERDPPLVHPDVDDPTQRLSPYLAAARLLQYQ